MFFVMYEYENHCMLYFGRIAWQFDFNTSEKGIFKAVRLHQMYQERLECRQ